MQRSLAVGIGIVPVEIVQQDQVEVGGRRHLAAAEPAHREDRGLLPLDAAVLGGELIPDQAVHGVHDALGDVGKGDAGLLGGNRAGEDARADQEQALLAEQPQAIEEVFVGVRVLQRRRQPRRQFLLVRHRAEETGIDQAVHDLRLARQHVAEPRRRAEDQRHQRDQIAVLPQERNQPAAALQGAEKAIERGHGVIRVFGMREPVDQAGHEFDEGGLGRFIAERAIIALHPELQRAGHRDRLLEAERRQMVEQARILRPCGVVDLRQLHRAGRIALEQLAVMSLHDVEMAEQILRKGCPALIAEEVRKALDGLGIFGQRMGLLVRDHLQPVLDAAQELVSRRQFVTAPER